MVSLITDPGILVPKPQCFHNSYKHQLWRQPLRERALVEMFFSSSMPSLNPTWAAGVTHLMLGPSSSVKTTSRENSTLALLFPIAVQLRGFTSLSNHDVEQQYLSAHCGRRYTAKLRKNLWACQKCSLSWSGYLLHGWIQFVKISKLYSWNVPFSICILHIVKK